MANSERRTHQRYSIKFDASLTYDQGKCQGVVHEISVDGARFVCSKAINPGTFISMHLALENSVVIRGAVVWTLESSQSGLPKYQIGIQIHDINLGGVSAQGQAERTNMIQEILSELNT